MDGVNYSHAVPAGFRMHPLVDLRPRGYYTGGENLTLPESSSEIRVLVQSSDHLEYPSELPYQVH